MAYRDVHAVLPLLSMEKRRTRNALAAVGCQRATCRDRSRRYRAAAVLLAQQILGDEIPVDELLHEGLHEIGRRF
jgi:hypothetical protein